VLGVKRVILHQFQLFEKTKKQNKMVMPQTFDDSRHSKCEVLAKAGKMKG